MKDFRRCKCNLVCNEVDRTEEFNNLIKDGWTVEKARYDPEDHCVWFFLTKEVDLNDRM